ncbi:MAG: hypothetical protein PUC00_10270 [Clostridiales bacterium]|nr:hypothetical protein [Clostridiales bacterium]
MHILFQAAVLVLAGAIGWGLAKDKYAPSPEEDIHMDAVDAADLPAEADDAPGVPAQVLTCYRRMNPLTLESANEAVFLLEDGEEVKLNFSGEGGLHLQAGDRGLLTWRGMRLIRFEKENGDVIGGMFYAPAGENADE